MQQRAGWTLFAWACLLVCWLGATQARAEPLERDTPVDWGPLTLRSRAPLFDNRLGYTVGRILPLKSSTWELSLSASHVNIWAQMPGYFFDGEWTRLAARLGYGFGDGFEATLDVALIGRYGGFLDGFIENFHSFFGVTQARRQLYAKNQLRVATLDGRGTRVWLSQNDAGVGLANPVLAVKKRLTQAGAFPAVVAELGVKLPVGSITRQFASNAVQLLFDVGLQQPFGGMFQVFAATGVIVSPGQNFVYSMQTSEVQKFLALGFEWRMALAWTAVIHYLNQDGAVEKAAYAPLNSTTHEFVLGAKWAPWADDAWVMEAGIIENTVHDANTPDFGFQLGSRWRL